MEDKTVRAGFASTREDDRDGVQIALDGENLVVNGWYDGSISTGELILTPADMKIIMGNAQ